MNWHLTQAPSIENFYFFTFGRKASFIVCYKSATSKFEVLIYSSVALLEQEN